MQYKDSRTRIGGLMRCCLSTINDFIENHLSDEVEEGKIIDCRYETARNKQIIFKNGAFEWNHE